MDTQPSNQPQEQSPEASPPAQNPTPAPKNRLWEIILGVVLILIILGTATWFILGKNSPPNPQSIPAPAPSASNYPPMVVVQSPPLPPTTTPANDLQAVKSFSVEDVKNAVLTPPYIADINNLQITGNIILKDGVGSFSYCQSNQTCQANQLKKGTLSLTNITIPAATSTLESLGWNGSNGTMIMVFDFGNGQPKSYYLTVFYFSAQENNPNTIYATSPIKNLGASEGQIQGLKIADNGQIIVTVQTASGVANRAFLFADGRGASLTELTPDQSGKIYDDGKFGYSFVYPSEISSSVGQSMEDSQMETTLNVSPLYHADECGLQPTFADSGVSFWSSNPNNNAVTLNAELTAHQVAAPKVYLTSALYGYDPADWGKVKQTVTIQDYINAINDGSAISGEQVTQMTIGNLSIRHIAPFVSGKPCDSQYREQYQWVAGNLLFNLVFTDATYGAATHNSLKTKLINSIFSSLNVK